MKKSNGAFSIFKSDKMSVAIAIILAVVFLGEPLTIKTAVGALLIIAGSIVLIM